MTISILSFSSKLFSKAKLILPASILIVFSLSVSAEQKKTFDQYDVHYSLVNSSFVSPEVAKTYNIIRGKDRAFINIAIRKQLENGTNKAQKAIVSGTSSDLMRKTSLEFKEIDENNAIYYIAEFKFYNEEIRNFVINVQPDPNKKAYQLKFSKKLYRDK